MKQYLELMERILSKGKRRLDRTGVGTIGLFGEQIRMNMADGFPLLTTKKVHVRSILYELLWFISGSTNISYLHRNGVTIWDEWADSDGELGPVYGKQWRKWEGIKECQDEHGSFLRTVVVDQLANLVRGLRNDPYGRRHIVSAWNPIDVPDMALPPCHTLWQCYVEETAKEVQHNPPCQLCRHVKHLSLHLYARSIDTFLGLPFNIASYAFLLHMLAHVTNMEPGELIISFGDVHIYLNHLAQCTQQLGRRPGVLPKLHFSRFVLEMGDFQYSDFVLSNYNPQPAIPAPVAK